MAVAGPMTTTTTVYFLRSTARPRKSSRLQAKQAGSPSSSTCSPGGKRKTSPVLVELKPRKRRKTPPARRKAHAGIVDIGIGPLTPPSSPPTTPITIPLAVEDIPDLELEPISSMGDDDTDTDGDHFEPSPIPHSQQQHQSMHHTPTPRRPRQASLWQTACRMRISQLVQWSQSRSCTPTPCPSLPSSPSKFGVLNPQQSSLEYEDVSMSESDSAEDDDSDSDDDLIVTDLRAEPYRPPEGWVAVEVALPLRTPPAPQPIPVATPLPKLSSLPVPGLGAMFFDPSSLTDSESEPCSDPQTPPSCQRRRRVQPKGTPPDPWRRAEWGRVWDASSSPLSVPTSYSRYHPYAYPHHFNPSSPTNAVGRWSGMSWGDGWEMNTSPSVGLGAGWAMGTGGSNWANGVGEDTSQQPQPQQWWTSLPSHSDSQSPPSSSTLFAGLEFTPAQSSSSSSSALFADSSPLYAPAEEQQQTWIPMELDPALEIGFLPTPSTSLEDGETGV